MIRRIFIPCIFLAACSSPTGAGPSASATLQFVSGTPAADTIGAGMDTVEIVVRNALGRAVSGAVVQFESPREDDIRLPFVRVFPPDGSVPEIETVTTDSDGSVRVGVYRGFFTGTAWLRVTASELSVTDSIKFEILPGSATRIRVTPPDTALILGKSMLMEAMVLDRFGNTRPEIAELVAESASVVLDGREGRATVTGLNYGRASIRATASGLESLGWISIVPDGTLAILVRPPSGGDTVGVATIRTDGSGFQMVYASTSILSHWLQTVDWAPDGLSLVLQLRSNDIERSDRVHKLALSGALRRLIAPSIGEAERSPRYGGDGWVYYSLVLDAVETSEIWKTRSDGSDAQRIGPAAAQFESDFFPDASPDGQRLVFTTDRSDGSPHARQLAVYDVATGNLQLLGIPGVVTPTWSPRGDRIAFTDTDAAINVIAPDGTGRRVLTNSVRYSEWIDWSPDSRWIVASSNGLAIIDADSGMVLPLAFAQNWWRPAWRP